MSEFDNIHFLIGDESTPNEEVVKNEDGDKIADDDMDKIMNDIKMFTNDYVVNNDCDNMVLDEGDMEYFIAKSAYESDATFYNEAYNVKDLLKICEYYGIDKHVKSAKCKKQDIYFVCQWMNMGNGNTGIFKNRKNK